MIAFDITGKIVVFMGDSITAGGFIDPTQRWSTRLTLENGGTEQNNGISGATLENNIDEYSCGRDWFRIANVPTKTSQMKYIFMAYGTNDILINRPSMNITNLTAQYEAAIDAIKNKGWPASSIVIVNGYWIPNLGVSYNDCGVQAARSRGEAEDFVNAINQVAISKGCVLADTYNDTKNNSAYNTVDGLHPDAPSHAIIKTYLDNMDYTPQGQQPGLKVIKGRNFIII